MHVLLITSDLQAIPVQVEETGVWLDASTCLSLEALEERYAGDLLFYDPLDGHTQTLKEWGYPVEFPSNFRRIVSLSMNGLAYLKLMRLVHSVREETGYDNLTISQILNKVIEKAVDDQ